MASILIVEDENIVGMNTEMFLNSLGHDVVGLVNNGKEALDMLQKHKPDLVLMDIRLHGNMSGIDVTRRINDGSDVPVVYMTSHSDSSTMEQVSRTRHFGVLVKPFSIGQFKDILSSINLN